MNVVITILQQIDVDGTIKVFPSFTFALASELSFDTFGNLEDASRREFCVEDGNSVEEGVVGEHVHGSCFDERGTADKGSHLLRHQLHSLVNVLLAVAKVGTKGDVYVHRN